MDFLKIFTAIWCFLEVFQDTVQTKGLTYKTLWENLTIIVCGNATQTSIRQKNKLINRDLKKTVCSTTVHNFQEMDPNPAQNMMVVDPTHISTPTLPLAPYMGLQMNEWMNFGDIRVWRIALRKRAKKRAFTKTNLKETSLVC